ncbi:MAG: type II secretion system protein [Propionibacteriales bacterium]|nr:type II secretion system protein [Propionibacteriales bacterium]
MTALLAGCAAGCLWWLSSTPSLRAGVDLRAVVAAGSALVGAAVVHVGFAWGLRLPLVMIAGVLVVATYRHTRVVRQRAASDRRTVAVIAACEGVAADLRAGRPPQAALQAGVRSWSEFALVADAGRLGADVPAALRDLAKLPGAGGLTSVAAAWTMAHRSGAGLADAVGLAVSVIRDQRATARVVETEMAAARATARLLAGLPVGVLLIGRSAGGDPFGFLLDSVPGLICLGLGLALVWAGLAWLERIARSVQP